MAPSSFTIRSARWTISSRRGIRTHTTRPRRGESRNGRQAERHARAGGARALDVDHAAVSLDQRLDDGEPEPGAADSPGLGSPIIRLEDPREHVVRHAGAAVENRDLDHRAGAAGDRESTRLKSSHGYNSYAVFFFEKKKKKTQRQALDIT